MITRRNMLAGFGASGAATVSACATLGAVDGLISAAYAAQAGLATPALLASIGALRAVAEPIGSAANLAGYAGVNDGGGGLFVADFADAISSDDGGTVIVDAAGTRWKRADTRRITAKMFGAKANGLDDDTAAIQAACNTTGLVVQLEPGRYLISDLIDIPNGVQLVGVGEATIIEQTSSDKTHCFELLGRRDSKIKGMRLVSPVLGSGRSAIKLTSCTNVHVEELWLTVTQGDGTLLLRMEDCDDCTATRLYFDGGPNRRGYAAHLNGCRGCRITNSTAINPDMGFVIIGGAIGGNIRPPDESFGNIIDHCHVRGHNAHAFDINEACGNVVSNCTAADYGGSLTHSAFQAKHSSVGNEVRGNVFVGCTATNVPGAFGCQQANKTAFIGCTGINIDRLISGNAMDESQIIGCVGYNVTVAGILLRSGSRRNNISGVTMESGDAALIGISFDSSCNENTVDQVQMIGTMAKAIEIHASASNNRFGPLVRVNSGVIDDASASTIWPVILTTPVIDLSETETAYGPYMVRGMTVAKARFVVVEAITGTPQVRSGWIEDDDGICADQIVAATTVLTQVAQSGNVPMTMMGKCTTAGSAGKGFFQYEGLARL